MTSAISLWIVRIAGIVQIVFGILFWTGRAYAFLPLHMITGMLIVVALWTLSVLALITRVRRRLAIFALLWGAALPALGAPQATLLVGPMHWIIRVIHFLMGLSALGIAAALSTAIVAGAPARARQPDLARGGVTKSRAP